MAENSYTSPNDHNRFGFSKAGEFRAPYKGEGFICGLLTACAAALVFVVLFLTVRLLRAESDKYQQTTLFIALTAIVALAIVIGVCVLIFGLGLRAVHKGYVCTFTANEDKFCISAGKNKQTIFYADVQMVYFQPRTNFAGAINGYDVTVKVNGNNEEFAIVSDGYLTPENTPFYIIQQRMDDVHQEENLERLKRNEGSSLGFTNRAISADEIQRARAKKTTAVDRMNELLGDVHGDMPAVGEGRDNVVLSDLVSLDTHASGSDFHSEEVKESYIGTDGREHTVDELLGKGVFYAPRKAKQNVFPAIVTFLAIITIYVLLNLPSSISDYKKLFNTNFQLLLLVLAFFVVLTFVNCLRKGRKFTYSANGREFVVESKNYPGGHIVYSEVISIDYTPIKFLWILRGFKADMYTRHGKYTYEHLLKKEIRTEKDLPFEIIRSNAERISGHKV